MIQIITRQIVMDQRPHDNNTESFSSTFGIAVGTVIQSYCELERLKDIESQVKNLEAQFELVSTQKENLEAEIAKLRIIPTQLELQDKDKRIHQLKEENNSLRELLRTSKETIAMLQFRLEEEKDPTPETISSSRSPGRLGKNIVNASSIAFGSLFSPLFNRKSTKKIPIDTPSIERETTSTESSSNRESLYSNYASSDKIPPSLLPSSVSTPESTPSNLPPPPPPPPPSSGAQPTVPVPPLIVPSRKELNHYSQIKLKNLQWQKMDMRTTHQTLWENNNETLQQNLEDTLNKKGAFDIIETLFPAKTNDFFEKRLYKQEAENDSIKFLKKEKNRNINIAILPQIKQLGSFKETRRHLLAMDDKLCTETFLTNLITYLPNKDDDLTTLQKYLDNSSDQEREALDLPEQFTVEMMSIYRYQTRLKYMLFRVQFWERFDRLKTSLSVVLSASDSLCESEAWKELMFIVLILELQVLIR
ncbi:hypothetical protein G6F56_009453 [Rhizopus delemar]|nr:hypothetical protein G6F56_009453 [Rhizopus delemar]